MNINLNDAIVVALFSTTIGFVIQFFFKWYDNRKIAKSFELSVIAEIEAILSIIDKRKYRETLEKGLVISMVSNDLAFLQIDIQQDYCPIYYNNLDKVSLLSKKRVKDVVWFYALLSSLVLDVKSGGILNSSEASPEAYQECLDLLQEATKLGKRIIK